jgi:hypothetical protein
MSPAAHQEETAHQTFNPKPWHDNETVEINPSCVSGSVGVSVCLTSASYR